jgi:two-component system LytT family response regulator
VRPSGIRTLIADDEPVARRGLRRLLADDHDLEIVGETGTGADTVDAVARLKVELLFLDVEMPDRSGLECLTAMRPPIPTVVFVTAFEQYALRAFEAEALDYVLKPFSNDRLAQVVRRAKAQVRQRRAGATDSRPARFATRLMVRTRAGMALIAVSEIDWIEAAGYRARIHARGRTHLLREPLHELETRLDPTHFVRIHRSAIVQIDRIREIQPYFRGSFAVILADGARVLLSRRRRAALESALGYAL